MIPVAIRPTTATSSPAASRPAKSAFIVWNDEDGHPNVQGPYPVEMAHELAPHAPALATVIATGASAPTRFRIIESLINHLAVTRPERRTTALIASGITHPDHAEQVELHAAMHTVLSNFGIDANVAEMADALIAAGFTTTR